MLENMFCNSVSGQGFDNEWTKQTMKQATRLLILSSIMKQPRLVFPGHKFINYETIKVSNFLAIDSPFNYKSVKQFSTVLFVVPPSKKTSVCISPLNCKLGRMRQKCDLVCKLQRALQLWWLICLGQVNYCDCHLFRSGQLWWLSSV